MSGVTTFKVGASRSSRAGSGDDTRSARWIRTPRCSELNDHLHEHTRDPDEHTRLFVQAQERAR